MLFLLLFGLILSIPFVVFVCGFSKWILSRRKAKGEPETAHGENVAAAVEAAGPDGGK